MIDDGRIGIPRHETAVDQGALPAACEAGEHAFGIFRRDIAQVVEGRFLDGKRAFRLAIFRLQRRTVREMFSRLGARFLQRREHPLDYQGAAFL